MELLLRPLGHRFEHVLASGLHFSRTASPLHAVSAIVGTFHPLSNRYSWYVRYPDSMCCFSVFCIIQSLLTLQQCYEHRLACPSILPLYIGKIRFWTTLIASPLYKKVVFPKCILYLWIPRILTYRKCVFHLPRAPPAKSLPFAYALSLRFIGLSPPVPGSPTSALLDPTTVCKRG